MNYKLFLQICTIVKTKMLSWNSSVLATSHKELTHWKRPWCWEGLGARGEGDGRRWDGWVASPTRWTWIWVNSGSWWWTRSPGVLQFMGSQRVRHDWVTELNWKTKIKAKWNWWAGNRNIWHAKPKIFIINGTFKKIPNLILQLIVNLPHPMLNYFSKV